MTRMLRLSVAAPRTLLIIGALICSVPGRAAPAGRIEFNRDIRPILSDNCFACHGPDRNKRKANLRLDQRPSARSAAPLSRATRKRAALSRGSRRPKQPCLCRRSPAIRS